jgi:heme-degrading monooxygenase HmoA
MRLNEAWTSMEWAGVATMTVPVAYVLAVVVGARKFVPVFGCARPAAVVSQTGTTKGGSMHARVSRFEVPTEDVDRGIRSFQDGLSDVRALSGNQGAFLLVDRESGNALSVTLWDSEKSIADSREQANRLRQEAADRASSPIQAVDEYEVPIWDVGV